MQARLPQPTLQTQQHDAVMKDQSELELENLLFGADRSDLLDNVLHATGNELNNARKNINDSNDDGNEDDEEFDMGFEIDTVGLRLDASSVLKQDTASSKNLEAKPAWVDQDIENMSVNIASSHTRLRKLRTSEEETSISGKEFEARLRKQHDKIYPKPQWATIETDTSNKDDDLFFLRKTHGIIDSNAARHQISPDMLDMCRLKDANQAEHCQSIVSSIQFHPSAPILLTSGLDKTLRLFQIDGKINPKIASAHFADMPITKAIFSSRHEIICAGKRRFFYSYDLESGKVEKIKHICGRDEKSLSKQFASPCGNYILFIGDCGYIIMISQSTKQWIANFKMNSPCADLDFSADGRFMFSFGADGDVYHWDMQSRTCVNKFFDEGAVKPSSISISQDGDYISTGSSTGVVNIYSSDSVMSSTTPSPIKSILNLTTAINNIAFHPSSQVLAISSNNKKDALKMCHLDKASGSIRVFANWPTDKTPLGYVQSIAFSPQGGYFGVGNDKGKVLLYQLKNFGSY